ncbi:hypothetical protein R1flu_023336 [Riccia fluitans]|uniref:Uncharacterized protein n=1 Tax=Riccia fluitans TaxID=41844 RepID=A0ABD1XRR8_9MARC
MHLKNAIPYTDTDNQREMINCFIDYLETGSIESHKRSQILWLQEEEPFIEVNLGFVEAYRDPQGSRAEFEGYVPVVNQAITYYTGQEAEDLMYISWLMMVRTGFLAIETYSEDTGFWTQAHAQLTTPPKYLLELKRIISANRRSRPMFVQAHTRITKNKKGESRVMLEEFDAI